MDTTEHEDVYQHEPQFVEWEPDTTLVRVPKLTLKQAGWKYVRSPVLRISAKSYVDMLTGEIISKRDMFKLKNRVPSNASMRWIEQLCTLNQLGKKSRELCVFLLQMRNNRGSFVVPLQQVLDGYIQRDGKVARLDKARNAYGNRIREIASLGILVNEQALGTMFQQHRKMCPKAVLEEGAVWLSWPGIFHGKALWS